MINTAQETKFCIKDFFIFCAVLYDTGALKLHIFTVFKIQILHEAFSQIVWQEK